MGKCDCVLKVLLPLQVDLFIKCLNQINILEKNKTKPKYSKLVNSIFNVNVP